MQFLYVWQSSETEKQVFYEKGGLKTEDFGVNGRYMYLETPSFKITKLRIPIAKNAAISANFLVWDFCEKAQFPNCFPTAFPQNFHSKKLGEITVFFVVTELVILFFHNAL